jgi:predicted nucleotidyltransferase
MNALIENNKSQIIELCKQYQVKELYAFGSILREDDFNINSDIDLLIEFKDVFEDSFYRMDNEDKLKEKLIILLKKEIDFIKYPLLKNKYLRHFINRDKKLIYAEA